MTDTPSATRLSPAELRRYSRHLSLPEVGPAGQEKLKAGRVLIVGAGGLGSPLGLYLAAAGVGTLGLVDCDRVEESNLQRQVLYGHRDVGRPKLEVAAARLAEVNPFVSLILHPTRLDSGNALEILGGYDVVADGSDNFPTRYLVNDACVLLGKPDVYGSVQRFEGQVAVFWGARGPCYRCLFAEPPPPHLVPSCAEGGVLGVLPGIVGALQASEALKLLLGVGEPLVGRLLVFDALAARLREVRLRRNPDCPVCSANPTQRHLIDYERFCGVAPSSGDLGPASLDVAPREVRRWLDQGRPLVLLDVRTPEEHAFAALPGTRLVPLAELPRRLAELDAAAETVVYCHFGPRSQAAVGFLRERGFDRVWNLAGGIDAWSRQVDPAVPLY